MEWREKERQRKRERERGKEMLNVHLKCVVSIKFMVSSAKLFL